MCCHPDYTGTLSAFKIFPRRVNTQSQPEVPSAMRGASLLDLVCCFWGWYLGQCEWQTRVLHHWTSAQQVVWGSGSVRSKCHLTKNESGDLGKAITSFFLQWGDSPWGEIRNSSIFRIPNWIQGSQGHIWDFHCRSDMLSKNISPADY